MENTIHTLRQRFAAVKEAGRCGHLPETVAVFEGTDIFSVEQTNTDRNNPAVFSAEIMRSLCRSIRGSLQNSRSPICIHKGDTSASVKVNEYIVGFFDDLLKMLEHAGSVPDADACQNLLHDAETTIECLMVEDRVCQS